MEKVGYKMIGLENISNKSIKIFQLTYNCISLER